MRDKRPSPSKRLQSVHKYQMGNKRELLIFLPQSRHLIGLSSAIYSQNYRETQFHKLQNRCPLLMITKKNRYLFINISPLYRVLSIKLYHLSKILYKSFHFKSYLTVKFWQLFYKTQIIALAATNINLKGINSLNGQKEHLCLESSKYSG